MKALLAVSAVLLTGPGTPYYDGLPPARYSGPATVTLKIVEPRRLEESCGRLETPENLTLLGCARTDWLGRRYIVIPDTCSDGACDKTARIIAHEVGHVLGWRSDHPL